LAVFLNEAFMPYELDAVTRLILVAAKAETITRFRTTIGLKGRLSTCLQPNHPTDDPKGIAAVILDGLLNGVGDAVIGINPVLQSSLIPFSESATCSGADLKMVLVLLERSFSRN
jgi:ethanolamine ammonia-lyase large subunit